MPTFLIEIPHSSNSFECQQVIKIFVESGNHLLQRAHWGCKDGVHKAWFIAEFDNKAQAMQTVPGYLKHSTTVVELAHFDKESIASWAHDQK